jgi:hypothetical protein
MSEEGEKKEVKEEQLLIVNTPEDRLRVLRLILARENAARKEEAQDPDDAAEEEK